MFTEAREGSSCACPVRTAHVGGAELSRLRRTGEVRLVFLGESVSDVPSKLNPLGTLI